jgi:hypothetical protein
MRYTMSIFDHMKRHRNNPVFTVFVYRTGKRYVGVCLELDLIDNGTDPEELEERMKKSVESYVRHVCANDRFDSSFLDRPAPKKYWDIFYRHVATLKKDAVPSRRATASEFFLSRQNLRSVCSV